MPAEDHRNTVAQARLLEELKRGVLLSNLLFNSAPEDLKAHAEISQGAIHCQFYSSRHLTYE